MDRPTTSFLACRDCWVLHPIPGLLIDYTDEAREDAFAAFHEFRVHHATHNTTHLQRQRCETFADRPLWDPLVTIGFQVTDGERDYIVQAARESIDEPRVYRFLPGTIGFTSSEVIVDDHDVRRALDRAFFPHALRPTTLDRFISILHDVVSHIPPDELEIAFDAAEDPSVSIARMPNGSYDELLARSAEIFDSWEWPRVTRFLSENRGEDGLLALRVRRHAHALSA